MFHNPKIVSVIESLLRGKSCVYKLKIVVNVDRWSLVYVKLSYKLVFLYSKLQLIDFGFKMHLLQRHALHSEVI